MSSNSLPQDDHAPGSALGPSVHPAGDGAASSPGSAGSPAVRVYVGAATPGSTFGVTAFALDPERPTLTARARVDGVDHPTYLAVHPNGKVLYAVSETGAGHVVALRAEEDRLVVAQRVSSGGDGPCHLSTDGRHLVVAHYGSGSADAFHLDPDGRITDRCSTHQHHGGGPHWRQDRPHAHAAVLDPRDGSLWVVDLGTDRIVRYEPGEAGYRPSAEIVLTPGSGPRHLAFHPDGTVAFVVCELDNTVVVVDVTTDGPTLRATVSTLPDTLPDDDPCDSLAAAIVVHPAGDRVYASNRGHDSIAAFAYRDGSLTPLGHVPSGGAGPRDIAVDASGSLLLAANQHTGEIAGFDVSSPGLPHPLGVLARVEAPTCVVMTGASR